MALNYFHSNIDSRNIDWLLQLKVMIICYQTFSLNKSAVGCCFYKKNTVCSTKHFAAREKNGLDFVYLYQTSQLLKVTFLMKMSHMIAY